MFRLIENNRKSTFSNEWNEVNHIFSLDNLYLIAKSVYAILNNN
jgi:hypothetical protein